MGVFEFAICVADPPAMPTVTDLIAIKLRDAAVEASLDGRVEHFSKFLVGIQ